MSQIPSCGVTWPDTLSLRYVTNPKLWCHVAGHFVNSGIRGLLTSSNLANFILLLEHCDMSQIPSCGVTWPDTLSTAGLEGY